MGDLADALNSNGEKEKCGKGGRSRWEKPQEGWAQMRQGEKTTEVINSHILLVACGMIYGTQLESRA